ncbi:MAG: isoamylase [Treponema sp.]|jgi:hypothetical protein|nr:isoamylase [Treponema sp.]
MKTIKKNRLLCFWFCGLFFAFPANLNAADVESHQVIEYLLGLPGPGAPVIIDDEAVFTAPSSCRRAGVAFAHEGFSKVHWFRQLLLSQENLDLLDTPKKTFNPYKDSGVLFYVYRLPDDLSELQYRVIIDGLWTVDPANPQSSMDSSVRLTYSVLKLPTREKKPELLSGPPGSLSFSFKGPPGETVTVAGSFNGWDPFMYQLKENPAGTYSLNIPLPPGRYQYVFFHRGERWLDPYNPNRAYSHDGQAASEVVIQ